MAGKRFSGFLDLFAVAHYGLPGTTAIFFFATTIGYASYNTTRSESDHKIRVTTVIVVRKQTQVIIILARMYP